MMSRCYNPNAGETWKYYGGRGITVCDEWHSFPAFAMWADANGGTDMSLEIDRIDGDGNYSPENCRFVPNKINARNKRKYMIKDGKSCTSRFKGVAWYKAYGKWQAQICIDGQHRNLGYFDSEEDAALAYNNAARGHEGCVLNVIGKDAQ